MSDQLRDEVRLWQAKCGEMAAEVATLRAQLEAAQSETERLKAELAEANKGAARWITLMGEAKAERGEMRIELAALRARHDALVKAAAEAVSAIDHATEIGYFAEGGSTQRWIRDTAKAMRAALETAAAGSSAAEGEG